MKGKASEADPLTRNPALLSTAVAHRCPSSLYCRAIGGAFMNGSLLQIGDLLSTMWCNFYNSAPKTWNKSGILLYILNHNVGRKSLFLMWAFTLFPGAE